MTNFKIKLAQDTITKIDLLHLSEWIKSGERLTKGPLTDCFENAWGKWNGSNHSIFVNSGSSANLAMYYAEQCCRDKKNLKIIVPAVSWSTTVSPAIQLGMDVYLCDSDEKTLGVSVCHLEKLFIKYNPDILVIVHVLGHINDMEKILELCDKYGVTLFEDCCEGPGTEKGGIKIGNYGKAASFSFYYGHHISTIEGGMIVTKDHEFSEIIKSIRSHGWSRDLLPKTKKKLANNYNISPFRELYTFYYPGFNLRSTDLNAFIGLRQLERIDSVVKRRFSVFSRYKENLSHHTWIQSCNAEIISNFGLGLIVDDIDKMVNGLKKESIEIRPLVCGSIGEQPFWIKYKNKQILQNATKVHTNGLYLPAHHNLTDNDVDYISDIVIGLL
jgi:CDP-4-dehydro-6-deoxyglucose reductase, E1